MADIPMTPELGSRLLRYFGDISHEKILSACIIITKHTKEYVMKVRKKKIEIA